MQLFIDPGDQSGPIHTTVMPCSLSPFVGTRALRTIASFCRTHVAAQLPGKRAVTPAQASGHFPAAQAHGHKKFDPDAFFQSKMGMGHGGLLLAEWLLVLPTLPESRLVLLTLHAPTRWCIWNENLPSCYDTDRAIEYQTFILIKSEAEKEVDPFFKQFSNKFKISLFDGQALEERK